MLKRQYNVIKVQEMCCASTKPEQSVPGSQWHAHQVDKVDGRNPALNLDGTSHDGAPTFSQRTLQWLKSFGWNID